MTEWTIHDASITIKHLQLVFGTVRHLTRHSEALAKSDVDFLRHLALYSPEAVGVGGVRVLVVADSLDTATPSTSHLQTPAARRGECGGRGSGGRQGRWLGNALVVHSESDTCRPTLIPRLQPNLYRATAASEGLRSC